MSPGKGNSTELLAGGLDRSGSEPVKPTHRITRLDQLSGNVNGQLSRIEVADLDSLTLLSGSGEVAGLDGTMTWVTPH